VCVWWKSLREIVCVWGWDGMGWDEIQWGGSTTVVEPVVAGERTVYIEDPAAPVHI